MTHEILALWKNDLCFRILLGDIWGIMNSKTTWKFGRPARLYLFDGSFGLHCSKMWGGQYFLDFNVENLGKNFIWGLVILFYLLVATQEFTFMVDLPFHSGLSWWFYGVTSHLPILLKEALKSSEGTKMLCLQIEASIILFSHVNPTC